MDEAAVPSIVPSLLWGTVAYTLYGVAMVLMKLGEPALASPREVLQRRDLQKSALAWAGGVACNFTFAATLGLALGLGHASVVAALNGVGLIVVAVLSWWVLHERLGRMGVGGMGLVVLGVAFIGWFATPPGPTPPLDDAVMLVFFGVVALSCVGAGVVTRLQPALGGPLLGAAAGALGGAAILLQKIFVAPLMEQTLAPTAFVLALATRLLVCVHVVRVRVAMSMGTRLRRRPAALIVHAPEVQQRGEPI